MNQMQEQFIQAKVLAQKLPLPHQSAAGSIALEFSVPFSISFQLLLCLLPSPGKDGL
jgi:hypothetical protein